MIAAGEQVYDEHCASCHGEKLRSTGAIPYIKEQRADGRARFDQMVMNGRGQMPAWQGIVSQDQLEALWVYIRSRARDYQNNRAAGGRYLRCIPASPIVVDRGNSYPCRRAGKRG